MLKKLVYILFLGLAVLLLLEIGLRMTGRFLTQEEKQYGEFLTYWNETHYEYALRRHISDTFFIDQPEFRYEYHTNSHGYRETEIDTSSGSCRILVFGDSFSEGMGAPNDSTWPHLLQGLLQRDGLPARVYNCSSSGGDPFFGYMGLKHEFLALDPTQVVFTFNTSDLADYVFRGGFSRFLPDSTVAFRKGPDWLPWYEKSHLVRAAVHSHRDFIPNMQMHQKTWQRLHEESFDSVLYCLKRVHGLCREAGVPLLVVTHGGPLEICLDPPEMRSVYDIEALDFGDIPVVHLNSKIETAIEGPDCMTYGWPLDGHYNSRGYALMAGFLHAAADSLYPGFWVRACQP